MTAKKTIAAKAQKTAQSDASIIKALRAELKAATVTIAALESDLNACRGDTVEHVRTDNGLTKHVMPLGAKEHSHTPSAVDAIRLFTWAAKGMGMERKDIIASLISQKFNPATVRARVSRIFTGLDESCYSEEIRARLGLDELTEEDAVDTDDVNEGQDEDAVFDPIEGEDDEGEGDE